MRLEETRIKLPVCILLLPFICGPEFRNFARMLYCCFVAYGQSAGAIGLGSLLAADGGQAVSKLNLFRAAILESGSVSGSVL